MSIFFYILYQPIHLNNIGNYRNRNIQIIARIDELKEIKNKNNERICFMKISDEMTVIDSPIFSDVYKETPKPWWSEVTCGDWPSKKTDSLESWDDRGWWQQHLRDAQAYNQLKSLIV